MPADFVQDAIVKTISGQHVWNPDKSLFDHLIGVISGDIWRLAVSKENKTTRPDDNVIQIEDHQASAELELVRKGQEQTFLSYLELRQPELRQLAESILRDPVRRNSLELSLKFDWSPTKVESLKRELRRAVDEFIELGDELAIKKRSGARTVEPRVSAGPPKSVLRTGEVLMAPDKHYDSVPEEILAALEVDEGI